MYRHVLCVFPYRVGVSHNLVWPPLGIEIIAAALRPHAEAIDVIDLRREKGRAVDFVRPDTDLVCFSVNWGRELDFVGQEIRSVPERFLTIVGGRIATQDPDKWLADFPNVDILVRGDGEEAIEEIASGKPLSDIEGISYRLDGEIVHNPMRRCAPVRDDLWPDRRLRRHVYSIAAEDVFRALALDFVASSRGCPFNCKFCSFNRNPWGEKRAWTARSPESIVREIEEIDAGIVFFVDDNFTHDPDRVAAICDLMLARGIRKRYIANARVEIAKRPDVLRKMERAGFMALLLGIESAHDKTLRSMRKGFDTRQLREYFRVLRRSRIILHGYFIVGNIGETEEEMLEIVPFAGELGLDTIVISPLRNEPYSGLEELVAENPGYHVDPHGFVYSDRYSPQHLMRLCKQIQKRFYTPGHLLRLLATKGLRNGLITPGMIARLPLFLVRKALENRKRRKARLKSERSAALARSE